ncbi:LysR family transcriptional regulator [Achromobacter xylosoxidans]|uniref:LysR family transcriptional regulator n=1 Tax=Alcaligenes xylosoxydans xylosoxydans TaxID=85698 RepID=UPI0015C64E0E|nr:LysR family transcriptional regulator [Achromobacter xylosoxidans]
MDKNISLDDIYYFVQVAKRGNFSATAQALDIPGATLSRRIAELEKRLGYALLQRTTRKVSLTALGERYLDECTGQLEGLLNAHERVRTYLESPEGNLRVSILPGLAPMLPSVAEELNRRFPKLSCEFELSSASKETELGGMDVHVRAGPQEDSPLIQKPLVSLRRILVASGRYLKSKGGPTSPEDLQQHDLIAAQIEGIWDLSRSGEVRSVELTPKYISNSIMLSMQLAERGLGITHVPLQLARQYVKDLDLQRVLPGWELPPVMIYALFESRVVSARATAFITVLKEHLQAQLVGNGTRECDPGALE